VKLGTLSGPELSERLKAGLYLRTGPFTIRLQSSVAELAPLLHLLYSEYPFIEGAPIADVHVRMAPPANVRRWWNPQVVFAADGEVPFAPFPRDHAMPLLEWGINWCIATRAHQYLMLHSGVMEKNGLGIVFPAWPGSGKSTLCAALANRGWRLLSDEFGLVRPQDGLLQPFPRLIPLKNESIAVMRKFAPQAVIGPTFPKTRKGDVAHMRPPSESVERADEPVRAALIVFPHFEQNATTELLPMPKARAFLKLSGNAFNYEMLGAAGFRAVAALIHSCSCYSLNYGSLEEALDTMNNLIAAKSAASAS
jgi:HprK-related kinase A